MSSTNGNGRSSSYRPRENRAAASKIAMEPGPKDEREGAWSVAQRLRMDLRFRRAMERAIKRGLEHPDESASGREQTKVA